MKPTNQPTNQPLRLFIKSKKMLLFFFFMMSLLSGQDLFSQNGFSWNTWVGCAEGANDRKSYTELIAEGLCHRACQGSTVTYTITGALTSQITNTVWHVVGGTILSTPNNSQCIVKWGSTSTGAIGFTTKQVATNTTVTIADLCVNLTINPVALFTIAPIDPSIRPPNIYNACTGQELFFENQSNNNGGTSITSYYWDFGDGTTSSQESPSHTYENEGTYTVILEVENQCSCNSKISYDIIVARKGVQIDCPSLVCQGQKATYKVPDDFAQTCSQFNWSVIGGTILQDPLYGRQIEVLWSENPASNGFGYVTFDPTGCSVSCYKASTLKIPIIKQSATIEGATDICGPTQILYKLPLWPTTDFVWEIVNDGTTNATLTYTDQRNEILLNTGSESGTVTLKCIYTNTLLNCGGVATPLSIVIKQPANIDGAIRTCLGNTETYTEASGLSVTWQLKKLPNGATTTFVGTAYSPIFTVTGDYSLIATHPTLCNPIAKIITVISNPVPLASDFVSPLTICPGATATYSFNNTVPGSVIRWQVTGGVILGTNSGNAVQILFGLPPASGPNYSIKLWRENSSSPACPSGMLTLTPYIPLPDTVIKGATLVNNIITVTPANVNPCGSKDWMYQVTQTDMEEYTWELLIQGTVTTIAGNISTPEPNKPWIISVLWNQFANQAVTLRLKTKKCLQYFVTDLPIVISSPTITINTTTPSICRDGFITFTLNTNTPQVPIITQGSSVLWDFGNGQTQTNNSSTVVYQYTTVSPTVINYAVKATITNPSGCVSVITTLPINVQVIMPPVALITPATGVSVIAPALITSVPVASRTLTLTLTANYAAASTITWYRTFNGIDTAITLPPLTLSYTVSAFGIYFAKLTSANGCSSFTNKVSFNQITPDNTPPCPLSFNPTITLANSCGTLTATVAGNPVSFSWLTSPTMVALPNQTATNAQFKTTNAGQYSVFYTATYNNNGVICKVTKEASILVPYIPDLRYGVSCGTGANYNVKLFNNSNFYPSAEPTVTYKIITINVAPTPNVTTTYTAAQVATGVPLPAGNYVARIELVKNPTPQYPSQYPMCYKEIPFTLVPKPSATTTAFTKSNSSTGAGTIGVVSTCPDAPVYLKLVGPTNPNYTYLWNFNNQAFNSKPNNLYVTFNENNTKTISLKVTDQYGCTYTTPGQTVNVSAAQQLSQSANPSSIKKCQGTPATLLFTTPPNTTPPVSYKWMLGNAPVALPAGALNPLITSIPGNYWLKTANSTGCLRTVQGYDVTVSFVDIPTPTIAALSQVCIANGVVLNSANGSDPNFQYIWYRNGSQVYIGASFTDFPTTIGTYTYLLEVRAPLGDGTVCVEISDPKTVTVIDSPLITNISYENIINPVTGTCNPFKIKLMATSDAIGTFAWSNGKNGDTVFDSSGGAYSVLFTSPSGCSATAQIYVPKDLSSYFWVVPKGCYTFCEKTPLANQQVLGPAVQEFTSWAWLQNGVTNPSGILAVTPKTIAAAGSYQLELSNANCSFQSDPFSVTIADCKGNNNCDRFAPSVTNIVAHTSPYIYYTLTVFVTNPTTASYLFTLTTQNDLGFFIPATINVPPGGASFPITFIANTNFGGGLVQIHFTTRDQNGNLCEAIKTITLPNAIGPSQRTTMRTEKTASLLLFPNPTADKVTIQYDFEAQGKQTEVQVYDTTMRLIARHNPITNKGSWELSLDQLAAGLYVVVLKQDEVVVAQQNVIKK
jgi:PKD repeat protein